MSPEVMDAICQSCLVRTQVEGLLVESLSVMADVIPVDYSEEAHGLPVVPAMSHSDLKDHQRADPTVREVIHQLESGEKIPPTVRSELPELPLLLREFTKLEMIEDILYRKRQENEQHVYQLVLPADLRESVLHSLHNDMGHPGIERTLDLVRARFYWPRMAMYVEQKIKACGRCVRRKTLTERAAPLVNIRTSRPLELICMDFLSLEPDTSNTKDILVLTDHFTKFAIAIPTPNQKARTVAKCLLDNFIIYFGIPERLHTDQGSDFESKLIKELCAMTGIKKCHTTPYHPRGNPVERFNRTLLAMLGTLEPKQKSKWIEYVKPLVHAYNCTRNEVTGYSPYELMFGRCPRLPIDLAFGLPICEKKCPSHSQYVQNLKSRLKESYQIASKNSARSAKRNKTRFDQRVLPSKLEVGDRVLVRNVRVRGKHKLCDKWEQDVYVVVKCAGDLPVYTVKPECKDGPLRTLHRDLLLPCGFLPMTDVERSTEIVPVTKSQIRRRTKKCQESSEDSAEGENCEQEEIPFYLVPPPLEFKMEEPLRQSSPPDDVENSVVPTISPVEKQPVEIFPDSESLESVVEMESIEPESSVEEQPDVSAEQGPPHSEDLSDLGSPVGETVPVPDPEISLNGSPNLDGINQINDIPPRRSTRHRVAPKRLQYTTLGNPLILVVQTLLHSLSDALVLTPTTSSDVHIV
ncbi:uncharacterized protein LOC108237361 [Kryptolebias marmoratus]|uniref:uncharacterized protein LOC108237361 n=1 Tax=Kryptolebias marmoratus TaxID=37003 RepID=UPI0018AC97C8|nr:uncharacterized protein LOC108237361 [Kryptolebias marmoratus]